jgi:HTH-type transcriptional regulator / antitoxin HigA
MANKACKTAHVPNAKTRAAMREARRGGRRRAKNVPSLLAELNADEVVSMPPRRRTRPIRSQVDYERALLEIKSLWHARPGTEEANRLEAIGALVEAYERRVYPLPTPDPVESAPRVMANRAKRTEHAGAKNGGACRGHRADAKRESAKRRREVDRREPLAPHDPMKHEQFRIGLVFYTGSGAWICTDIGTRVIVAVQAHLLHDRAAGPPYEWVEYSFDEYDQAGCSTLPFDVRVPNAKTRAAMREARGGGLRSAKNVSALLAELNEPATSTTGKNPAKKTGRAKPGSNGR